jgi:streptomycin 6-kinase
MSVFVPDCLRESFADADAEGLRWLEELPGRVAELERDWSVTAGRAFERYASCSWVAPARLADGSAAVLKISWPHREARYEGEALRLIDGRGAVRLLRVSEDGFSLLIERCVPGSDLGSLAEEEGDAVGADILRQLWREAPASSPIELLSDLAREWCEELPRTAPEAGYDPGIVARAVEMAEALAATQPQSVLLHGDFHPGNVLSAAREPWLAIDCKPLLGEPAYDLAQWLGNRVDGAEQTPDPVATLRRQIDRFADRLGLDPARIAGWAFVKSLGWNWGAHSARLFGAVAGIG